MSYLRKPTYFRLATNKVASCPELYCKWNSLGVALKGITDDKYMKYSRTLKAVQGKGMGIQWAIDKDQI